MSRSWPDPTLDEGPGDDRVAGRLAVGAVLIVVVLAALGAEASFLAAKQMPEKWQAITEVEFRDPNLLGESVATIFKSPSMWVPVAEREGIEQADFQEHYASSVQDGTQIVRITFDDADRDLAERVVTGVTDAYMSRFEAPKDNAQTVTISNYIEELQRVEATLVAALQAPDLSFEQTATQQQQLVAVRQQLANAQLTIDTRATAQADAAATEPRVVTQAFIADEPISPRPMKLALFGGVAGGVTGIATCFLVLHRTAQRQPAPPPGAPVPSLLTAPPPHRSRWSRASLAAKRTLDVVVSGLLLVVLSPLLAVISALIVITSGRPVLFRQDRVGQHGATFRIVKFRTMAVDNDDSEHRAFQSELIAGTAVAAPDGIYKLSDRRVTPIGRWLRRLSLDELPQLWNVLRGEMSLVGPRPALQWEADLFSPRQRLRMLVPPGCSGLWQVSGRNKLTTPEMLELDAQYVQRWSFGRDLSILVRTPFAMLRGDGAR